MHITTEHDLCPHIVDRLIDVHVAGLRATTTMRDTLMRGLIDFIAEHLEIPEEMAMMTADTGLKEIVRARKAGTPYLHTDGYYETSDRGRVLEGEFRPNVPKAYDPAKNNDYTGELRRNPDDGLPRAAKRPGSTRVEQDDGLDALAKVLESLFGGDGHRQAFAEAMSKTLGGGVATVSSTDFNHAEFQAGLKAMGFEFLEVAPGISGARFPVPPTAANAKEIHEAMEKSFQGTDYKDAKSALYALRKVVKDVGLTPLDETKAD